MNNLIIIKVFLDHLIIFLASNFIYITITNNSNYKVPLILPSFHFNINLRIILNCCIILYCQNGPIQFLLLFITTIFIIIPINLITINYLILNLIPNFNFYKYYWNFFFIYYHLNRKNSYFTPTSFKNIMYFPILNSCNFVPFTTYHFLLTFLNNLFIA